MAWARTVAVVVPSPATSDVLLATSRTIWAPMFSRPSRSSISLATVTPSLVMVGEPNFFSMTTLRPLGPRVTFTASARRLTPRRIAWRDSSPCTICFAIILFSFRDKNFFTIRGAGVHEVNLRPSIQNLAARADGFFLVRAGRSGVRSASKDAENFFFFHDDEVFAIDLDFGAGIFAEQDAVAFFNGERESLAFVVGAAFAGGDDFALLWFIFCV